MTFIYEDVAPVLPGSQEANDNLRGWMARQGDQGNTPRTVLHYAYPRDDAAVLAQSDIVRELHRRGLTTRPTSLRHGLVIQHDAIVVSDRFDMLTEDLVDLLAGHGWEYDAWECEVQPHAAFAGAADQRGLSFS